MTFTNAKQKLPKVFEDKIEADKAWEALRSDTVVHVGEKMMEARKARAAVLVARDHCAQFIREALKP